jgi:histone deacetylase complex subunit SAP18
VPSNELQIYTWLDANLKELTRLITEVYPNTKTKGTKFSFAVIYPSPRTPVFNLKEIGQTTIGTKGPDDNVTLQSKRFVIGDYLDVAIDVARAKPSGGGGGAGGNNDRDRDRNQRDRDQRDNRNNRRMRPYPDYR